MAASGLDVIDDEQGAILVGQLLKRGQKVVVAGTNASLPLDGLHQKSDRIGCDGRLEGIGITDPYLITD